jgi:FAD/FMN-containing dehydrogenase
MSDPSIEQLREQVRAPVLTAEDPGYDEARTVHNGMFDKRPRVIIRAEQVADVIGAVNFARDAGLDLSVKGGGHSAPGFGTNDDGVVIDLSLMRHVHVDPQARTALAGGGATWGDFNYATHAYGLATTGGIISTTGIGGLTLGGGIGYLCRGHGLSIDNLVSAEVVTADGQVRVANKDDNADLFWALRGGGGNFGVVASFELRLHELGPEVFALNVAYPIEDAAPVLTAWRDAVADAPDELSTAGLIWSLPIVDELPEQLRGRPYVGVAGMWAGDPAEGERATQALRKLATPLLDMSGRVPYLDFQRSLDPFFPAGPRRYWKALYLDGFSDAAIEATVERSNRRPSNDTLVIIRHGGGAISRVGAEETAFGDRSSEWMLSIDSTWNDAAEDEVNVAYTREFYDASLPYSDGKTYFNFPGLLEEGDAAVRDSYGANHDRLARIKAAYDPENLFRLNQNIRPAA